MCDEVFLSLLVRLLSLAQKKKKKKFVSGKEEEGIRGGEGGRVWELEDAVVAVQKGGCLLGGAYFKYTFEGFI